MDWSLSKDTHFVINLVATVDKMLEIFNIGLICSIVKVLQDSSRKLVFANFKRSLSKCR